MITLESISKTIGNIMDKDGVDPSVTVDRLEIDVESFQQMDFIVGISQIVFTDGPLGIFMSGLMAGIEYAREDTENKLNTKYEDYWNDQG
jgi:hypothetical protein